MDSLFKAARHAAGLPKFERQCKKVKHKKRLTRAYKVPGTPECDEWLNLCREAEQVRKAWERGSTYKGLNPPKFLSRCRWERYGVTYDGEPGEPMPRTTFFRMRHEAEFFAEKETLYGSYPARMFEAHIEHDKMNID